MKFSFKCNLSSYRTPSQLLRIAQLKAQLEGLGCWCDRDATKRFDLIQRDFRSELCNEGFFLYSDGGRLSVASHEGAFEEDANCHVTLRQLEYLCLILRCDHKDATHYIKRGTYHIPVLAVKGGDGKNIWHYYENKRWVAFERNDKEGLKKLFGKKFEWAVNKYSRNDERRYRWNQSLGQSPNFETAIVPKGRPQTAFDELW